MMLSKRWIFFVFISTVAACYTEVALSAPQTSTEPPIPNFRKDYTYSKKQNAFYKFHNSPRKWSEAINICKGEGAQLLVVKSQDEAEELLQTYTINYVWIGIHDIFSESDFVTLDGRPLSESYVKWAPNEPNNYNNNEDCVVMNVNGEYNDLSCDSKMPWICKKMAQNITQNTACGTYDLEYEYFPEHGKCYKIHITPVSWHSAFQRCLDEEANLVVVNSPSEAMLVSSLFSRHPESSIKGSTNKEFIFIGFSDLYAHGTYLTTDGKTLTESGFDKWYTNQPDNYEDKEHCGSLHRDGTLNDIDCNGRALFVCEKTI